MQKTILLYFTSYYTEDSLDLPSSSSSTNFLPMDMGSLTASTEMTQASLL